MSRGESFIFGAEQARARDLASQAHLEAFDFIFEADLGIDTRGVSSIQWPAESDRFECEFLDRMELEDSSGVTYQIFARGMPSPEQMEEAIKLRRERVRADAREPRMRLDMAMLAVIEERVARLERRVDLLWAKNIEDVCAEAIQLAKDVEAAQYPERWVSVWENDEDELPVCIGPLSEFPDVAAAIDAVPPGTRVEVECAIVFQDLNVLGRSNGWTDFGCEVIHECKLHPGHRWVESFRWRVPTTEEREPEAHEEAGLDAPPSEMLERCIHCQEMEEEP